MFPPRSNSLPSKENAMRIVNRLDFLKLPSGTLYQQAEQPWAFDDVHVKYDSLIHSADGDGDFVCMSFKWIEADSSDELDRRLDDMAENGASYPLDLEATQRDGLFERNAKFLVYERADVVALRDFFVDLVENMSAPTEAVKHAS
jgi:hypothetical protein